MLFENGYFLQRYMPSFDMKCFTGDWWNWRPSGRQESLGFNPAQKAEFSAALSTSRKKKPKQRGNMFIYIYTHNMYIV